MTGAITDPGFHRKERTSLQKMKRLICDVVDLYDDYKIAMTKNFSITHILNNGFDSKECVVDFNEAHFMEAVRTRMIAFPVSLKNVQENEKNIINLSDSLLDFVEFCWKSINDYVVECFDGIPHHETIDGDENKEAFRERINSIFEEHGVSFSLNAAGKVDAVLPQGLDELAGEARSRKSEREVDNLIDQAAEHIRKPRLEDKQTALEKLWDAFERIKTVLNTDKQKGAMLLAEKAADSSGSFQNLIEEEMKRLTKIGNEDFAIRHSETDRSKIESAEQADYLFHRMLSLLDLLRKFIHSDY